MKIGSMFSGVGGLDLALHAIWPDAELAWLCEYDDAASRVLDVRFPGVPNHHDVTTTDWSSVEPVDVVCGGFPCQDISHAGKRAGIKEGTRSGLWFDMLDAVRVLRPRLLLLENVAAITSADGGLDVVLGSLAEAGWDAEWTLLRASEVGAPHRRDRWFCIAYSSGSGAGRDSGAVPRAATEGGRARADVHASRDGRPDAAHATSDTGRISDGDRSLAADARSDGLVRSSEQDLGTVEPGQQAPRRGDPQRLDQAPADPLGLGRLDRRAELHDAEPDSRDAQGHRPAGRDLGDARWVSSYEGREVDYGPAIRRWEAVTGRRAPAPIDADGRLNPDFVEWMMGWPAGWTDIPGSSRTHRLKQCGNGVVPHQAYAAYSHLLASLDARQEVA